MAPSIEITPKFKIFFYSNDHEPIHVHVKAADCSCKIELNTLNVSNVKGFSPKQLKRVVKIVETHKELITEVWNEFFKK
jgi:hypothetical protein